MALSDAITLKQLRALVAVAETGSISAAAHRLCVTAPAVSTQIKTLEDNLGVVLLSRPALTPNAAGVELVAAARRVDVTLDVALQRMAALQAGRAGRVALGATSTAKYFVPFLIARVAREMPELEVTLTIGNRSEIIADLSSGRLDLAITGRPPRLPAVEARVVGDHPHVWIAAPGHPLTAERALPVPRLFDETILTREDGSGTRILMTRLLAAHADEPHYRQLVFNSNESIKQGVMAGLGIAFISGHTVFRELEEGRLALIDVIGAPVIRRWFVVQLAGTPPSGATRRLADFIVSLDGVFLPHSPADWSPRAFAGAMDAF